MGIDHKLKGSSILKDIPLVSVKGFLYFSFYYYRVVAVINSIATWKKF